MGAKTSCTSRVKSISVLKEKLTVYDMKASLTKFEFEMILSDVPKGEINITPTDIQ